MIRLFPRFLIALAVALPAGAGCSVPGGHESFVLQRKPRQAVTHGLGEDAGSARRQATDNQDQPGSVESDSKPRLTERQRQLAEIELELQRRTDLSPETKAGLLRDLKATSPEQWDAMLKIYRWALDHKRRQLRSAPQRHESGHALSSRRAADRPSETQDTAAVEAPTPSLPDPPANTQPVSSVKLAANSHARLNRESEPSPSDLPESATVSEQKGEPAGPTPSPPAKIDVVEKRYAAQASQAAADQEPVAAADPFNAAKDAPLAWTDHLHRAAELLEDEAPEPARSAHDMRRHAVLRLLRLAEGEKSAALAPISGIPSAQQDYWSEQLFSLATLLDEGSEMDGRDRAAEARRHLLEAAAKLGELSVLEIHNPVFCTAVNSYGVYDRFDAYEFEPSEKLLLYVEIENFTSEQTAEGYATTLRSSYVIHDARGNQIAEHDFATTEDVCQNRRRDFFMRYLIQLPERIYKGTYTLTLTVEDVRREQFAETKLEFEVVENP